MAAEAPEAGRRSVDDLREWVERQYSDDRSRADGCPVGSASYLVKLYRCIAALVLLVLSGLGFAHPAGAVPQAAQCATSGRDLVICVDTSTQTATVLQRGAVVLDMGTVTTSRIDTDCPTPRRQYINCGGVGDHITPFGRWLVSCTDDLTGTSPDRCNPVSPGLAYLVQFPNATAWNTSLHRYNEVGAAFDSHGCVRETWWAAPRVFALVTSQRQAGGRVIVEVKL